MQHNNRCEWLRCVRNPNASTNDQPKSYTSNGYLWGSFTIDTGSETDEFGAIRDQQTGVVRFRGWLNVSAADRLYLVRHNETWLIDGVRKDLSTYETVCDVHRLIDYKFRYEGTGGLTTG